MMLIYTSDRQGLCNRESVSKLQESLIQALQGQIVHNHPDDMGFFPRLLLIISNLRELSVEHRRLLSSIEEKVEQGEDLLAEKFGYIE